MRAAAVPLGAERVEDATTGPNGPEREVLRLLGAGLADGTAGQRLGVSSRPVNRLMASVMERPGATSRFEAGGKAAHKGWLQHPARLPGARKSRRCPLPGGPPVGRNAIAQR
ncbi:hypothetical protein [Kitasatospora sp. NPDC088134]|uniref:hypothetical protein n=1 Tax=Kitasatospora sp. NPDC088134 TaxID=3364071 RepID=UPI0037FA8B74